MLHERPNRDQAMRMNAGQARARPHAGALAAGRIGLLGGRLHRGLVLTLLAGSVSAQPAGEPQFGAARSFQDAAEWSRRFDRDARDAWQKPEEVLRVLALRPDAVVADIGAGTGYFTIRLADVLPRGRVYAVDVEPEMIQHLRERARVAKIDNLHALEASRDDPRLPEAVDLALLVNVQGLMVNPRDYFARLRASLKPGGRVAIISARPGASPGPPAAMRVSAEKVKSDMAAQGYVLVAEHDFLPRQFFLVFAPRE
jgi:predicted methyltransferase